MVFAFAYQKLTFHISSVGDDSFYFRIELEVINQLSKIWKQILFRYYLLFIGKQLSIVSNKSRVVNSLCKFVTVHNLPFKARGLAITVSRHLWYLLVPALLP